ncbi:WhiB family transcriptional regulator [Egibacter rhizosphaerae]|uniref:Transcriptional regulator WhiB n=1 Tax=Egibacter rhizosphaerae TaxID=1670831 RepID=A0A411YE20_9ACTN|nr:WhiB family transcriptional regulator [Egibacter rhizosphaerae]QBI19448.1 WhiB family transcriptional regulator [Egibacter rhizosphaerae]
MARSRSPQPDLAQATERDWQDYAACREVDADVFFPPVDVEPTADRLAREAAAKEVCAGCPVRLECLHWALSVGEPHGVWGGHTESERRQLVLQRRTAS